MPDLTFTEILSRLMVLRAQVSGPHSVPVARN